MHEREPVIFGQMVQAWWQVVL